MNTQEINTDALDLALSFVGGQINEPNLPKIVGSLYQTISAALERGYTAGAYAAHDSASTFNQSAWDEGYVAGANDARTDPDLADEMLEDITADYIGSIQQAAEAFETPEKLAD